MGKMKDRGGIPSAPWSDYRNSLVFLSGKGAKKKGTRQKKRPETLDGRCERCSPPRGVEGL